MQTQEKHSQAAVLGLQHLLAMYSGSILVPIMIATALGYSAEQLTYLISTDIFMCGVATFLQLQLNKYFGIGLPVVLGVAFQSVAPLIMIGQSHGSGAMFGALIASGIYVVLVSGIFSKVANLFPSIVTGSVITTIGLTLIPVAIGNMGNNVPEPTGQSLLLSAITVLIILLINIFTKGFIKSISILIGLVVGTAIAATMGLVDFSPVAVAPLVHVPTPLYFGMPTFEISSIVMMCIIATVTAQKVWRYFSEESLTPSLTPDFHKTLVWLNCQASKNACQSTTQLVSWFSLDCFLSLVPLPKSFQAPSSAVPCW